MAKETDKSLSEAMRKEKDVKVYKKIMALMFVLEDDVGVPETARRVRCSENSVRNWLARFSEDGIDGLRDLPRSGCRPKVDRESIAAIMDLSTACKSTDVMTVRDDIRDATGTEYSTGHVRKLMRQHGLSRRKVQNVHVNHATPSSVYSWQRYLENVRIPCLKREGFTLVSSDEAFFVQGAYDRYVWSPVGTRSVASYSGDHTKVAVFGSIAEDGRRLFRTFTGSFRSVQFIQCLEALRAKFGKVAVFCDRWSVHRSIDVAEYLAGHPDIRLIMIPKGSPYLNIVEECWNLGKPVVFRGIVYRKISELRHAISEYYRTVSFAHLCMYKYIYRSPVKALNYL